MMLAFLSTPIYAGHSGYKMVTLVVKIRHKKTVSNGSHDFYSFAVFLMTHRAPRYRQ